MTIKLVKGNHITFTLELRRGKDLEQNLAAATELRAVLKDTDKLEGDAADVEIISPDSRIVYDTPSVGFVELTFTSDDTDALVLDKLYDLGFQAKFAADNFVEWNEPRAVKVVRQIIANA
jgi:hypothetical protein